MTSKTTVTAIFSAILSICGFIILPLMQGTEISEGNMAMVGASLAAALGLFFAKDATPTIKP